MRKHSISAKEYLNLHDLVGKLIGQVNNIAADNLKLKSKVENICLNPSGPKNESFGTRPNIQSKETSLNKDTKSPSSSVPFSDAVKINKRSDIEAQSSRAVYSAQCDEGICEESEESWQTVRKKSHNRNSKPQNNQGACGLSASSLKKKSLFWVVGKLELTSKLSITRFEAEDLKSFLTNTRNFTDVSVEKLTSRYPEVYSSFKVGLPSSSIEEAFSPQFWPKGTFVNKFFTRKENLNSKDKSKITTSNFQVNKCERQRNSHNYVPERSRDD
ncbi:hypothetical protein J6590_076838 [Homalodisca vitripennis]|nr:hypothetical protein J6590_076838 [Homalodisca vitripennis]